MGKEKLREHSWGSFAELALSCLEILLGELSYEGSVKGEKSSILFYKRNHVPLFSLSY